MDSNKDRAEHAAYNADTKTADLILALGQEHIRAQQASSIALDSRCTQVAAIQMSALALALAFIAGGKATEVASIMIALAAAFFMFGTMAAFHAILSGYQKLPGVPPCWWFKAEEASPTLKAAKCWAAGEAQHSIDFNNEINERKGDTLNRSIHLAAVGVLFAFLAVIAQLA